MAKNNWGNYTQSHVVELPNGVNVFISYWTPVAFVKNGVVYLTLKKFSSTTSKQVTRFARFSAGKTYLNNDDFIKALKDIGYDGELGRLVGY